MLKIFEVKTNIQVYKRFTSYILLLLVPVSFGLLSLKLGQDINWDLQNYHIYNPYAYLHGRINYDLAPAGLQTYFNPYIDILYYLAITSWNPKLVGFTLGFLQGVNFIFLYGIYRNVVESFKVTIKFSFFLSLTGILTVGFLSEVGTAIHDSLTAIFSLSALFIVTCHIPNIYNNNQKAVLAVLAAGLILGFGSALKLVTAIFALAMCFSFFILPIPWARKFKFSLIFGGSVVVGLLISGGYWFYFIWHNFGNPIFPQFNHIFGGELAVVEPIRDERFLPKSLFEKVFYPIIFTINPNRVSEIAYKQFNWLIIYISLFVFFGNQLLNRIKDNPLTRELTSEAKFVLTYFCLAYVLWLNIFGIYRYLIAIEVLIPLLLFVIATYLFKSKLLHLIAVFFIGAITLVNLYGIPDWGRASWSNQVFHVDNNGLQKAKPAVIFLGNQPMAWLIPALNPEAPVIHVVPNFPASSVYWQRAESLIKARPGKLYIILESQNQSIIDNANKGLSNINLSIDTNSCTSFDAYLGDKNFKYTYCEVNKNQN